ncbi:Gfo/Idh/MocA family protein [Lacipirellula limnantheis]|uniref:Inositol 2-dehydrogenase n=1 Tax=Lacipirellula limnantheis TaxID=2528024 RepID=A0A517U2I5_9BACT|nr:Gfo/Idh/MocA family oxidoreductase [Lacipirellula limnantheis]QDT74820.1 Inositol 2-dehydrogenase [Lacipirellula limnantheis]
MKSTVLTRRGALKCSLAWAGAAVWTHRAPRALGFTNANARPRVAAIGTGSRWCQRATGIDGPHGSAPSFVPFGDYVAVCDVDADRLGLAVDVVQEWTGKAPDAYGDYRRVIDRNDVDVVQISTPDHWHAKIAIEAMLAGKDVYCEKPMTLTIDEGRLMCEVCRKTGRVVQIGTQQRSDESFLTALAIIRDGRIGTIKKATCAIGGGPTSPVIPQVAAPKNLDWNQWLGPAPDAGYRYLAGDNGETQSWSRCHYEFRWWYEYSGGKLTDWGAHHVDIATWAMEKGATGPTLIEPLAVKHPVPFSAGFPTDDTQYNTATEFLIKATFADGMELEIRHDGDNGILFEGTEGRLFVNRGKVAGAAVDDLANRPLPDGALRAVYKGKEPTDHFRNFFDAVVDRSEPISDVHSHHRALTTCHLAGIAARLGRTIRWSPTAEKIVDDPQAQSFVSRAPRNGFETEV